MNGSQIQVTRLKVQEPAPLPEITEEIMDGWVGVIGMFPPGSQLDDYFEREDGQQYGIEPMGGDAAIRQQIEAYGWSGAQVRVWGRLLNGIPDVGGRQIQVELIEAISGPETESRNLSRYASASASSVLPSDRWGTYLPSLPSTACSAPPGRKGLKGPELVSGSPSLSLALLRCTASASR